MSRPMPDIKSYVNLCLSIQRVKEMQASTSTTTYKVSLTHVASIHAGSQMVMQLLNIIFNRCLLFLLSLFTVVAFNVDVIISNY